MQSAPITHYLFRATEKNFLVNRLYNKSNRKRKNEEIYELWRKIYDTFQNIYMQDEISKKQKKNMLNEVMKMNML